MKKQITPLAVASALALGFGPLSAGAVEFKEVQEQYPTLTGWNESEWNDYLEEQYGTSLSEYETIEDLEADIGPPINLDTLGSDNGEDENILDIMEKYNLETNELVSFLENYDNREDIHFAGDLENALIDEGYQPVNDLESNESSTSEESSESNQASSEEAGENSQAASEDAGGIDPAELEETYLIPLGWSLDEFNQYLNDNFDMDVNDFNLIEDLETTVGPILTEENELELLEEYDLTQEEYSSLLAEYGETPEDYVFLYDLRDSLEYYTSDQPNNAETEKGAEMPHTASNSVTFILMGLGAMMLGGLLIKGRNKYGER